MFSEERRLLRIAIATLVCFVAFWAVACALGPARARADDSFSLVPTMTAVSNDYPPQQLLAAARIQVDASGHVTANLGMPFDYVRYSADDPQHTHPLQTIGTGSILMTGSYRPDLYSMQGRYHLEYTTETTGGWMGSDRRTDVYEGTFSAVITGPGTEVAVTVKSTWTNQHYSFSAGQWVPSESGSGQFTEVFKYRQVGGPTPPPPMATVENCGNSWISFDGGASFTPLTDGDVLRPGCIVRTEDVPEATAPYLKGGGRTILVFGKGFRQTIEPNSTVRVYDWGAQVESGSVVTESNPNQPYGPGSSTGFCSGKDPGAFQYPQQLTSEAVGRPALLEKAAAAGSSHYRVEVTPEGMEVAVFSGKVYAKSTVTQAVVQLSAGQSVTLGSGGLSPVSGKTFVDVTASDPYRTAIIGMALRGIVSGYQAGTAWEFHPLDSVKRAQFAKMIDGVMQLPATEDMAVPFTDLGPDELDDLYPHEYVAMAAAAGITTGLKEPGRFGPYDPITRAQMTTMIVRAANMLWPGLLDTPPAGWTGAMSSFTDGTHGPNLHMAEYNGLLEGLSGFGKSWDPWKYATRGEVAQMLWNLMTR